MFPGRCYPKLTGPQKVVLYSWVTVILSFSFFFGIVCIALLGGQHDIMNGEEAGQRGPESGS